MRDGKPRKIAQGPNRQEHEADKEKSRKNKDAIDHFALGNQVHEITGDQKAFAEGDEERHADIDRAMAERNVRGPHGNKCPEKQRVEYEQVAADVMAEVVGRMLFGRGHGNKIGFELIDAKAHHNKYRTGKRKIQTKSTKCQNKPEISMRLVKRSRSVSHI